MYREKRDTTRNISRSISRFPLFFVLYLGNLDYWLGQCTSRNAWSNLTFFLCLRLLIIVAVVLVVLVVVVRVGVLLHLCTTTMQTIRVRTIDLEQRVTPRAIEVNFKAGSNVATTDVKFNSRDIVTQATIHLNFATIISYIFQED